VFFDSVSVGLALLPSSALRGYTFEIGSDIVVGSGKREPVHTLLCTAGLRA
jgi:hypothetical protein